ncbi:MAG: phosphatase PAP2 family protein [Patescibacteria group bacterium]
MHLFPFLLFGGLGLFLVIYNNLKQKRAPYYWESPLDRAIPFMPASVVFYFLYFPLIVGTFFALRESVFEIGFLAATNLSLYLSLIVYYFFPSTIRRPTLHEGRRRDVFESVVALMYRVDRTTNGFPSAHVYVTVICGYYLMLAFPAAAWPLWVLAGAIITSTTLVKQHYVIDIVGGILWGLGAIAVVNWIF